MSIEELAHLVHAANEVLRGVLRQGRSRRTATDCLAALRRELADPSRDARELHDRWLETAPRDHPAAVPWESLPPLEQAKDEMFLALVNAARPFVEPEA